MLMPIRVNRAMVAHPFTFGQQDLNTVMGRLLGDESPKHRPGQNQNAVDVREDENHLYVVAELPGFKKDEVEITLEKQLLTITAERKEQAETSGAWLLRERRQTHFSRSFTLPESVSEQPVNARLESGELTITLNKREQSKPRKIAVQ